MASGPPLSSAPLANGVGVVSGSDPPVVLLVVDDSGDDELVSIFAPRGHRAVTELRGRLVILAHVRDRAVHH